MTKADKKIPKTITTAELMAIDYRYNYTDGELHRDWQRLRTTTVYKRGAQFKPGMKLCQHFFDNFWHIMDDRGRSFADAWQDPKIMNEVREWGLRGMSNLWLSWIRRAVYMRASLPNSSFYRPHFAKQICEMQMAHTGLLFEDHVLFDPCMGWGGRLLGTVAQGWHYVGCDPNVETYNNIQRMVDFLNIAPMVELNNHGAELFDFQGRKKQQRLVDAVLTSPPYFDLEVYTTDREQSYNKHDNYASWRDEWYVPLIKNCLSILKDDGISAWNVMNSKNNNMVDDLLAAHNYLGWQLVGTLGFDSPLANIRRLKNRDVTYLFRKKS